MYYYNSRVDFSELVGKTLINVVVSSGNAQIDFITDTGDTYQMYHEQDCCESVNIEDIVGDLSDLIGTPITMAEEVDSEDPGPQSDYEESYTWTFYKLATIKGYVDIRWYGSSNGYYSEGVDFVKLPRD